MQSDQRKDTAGARACQRSGQERQSRCQCSGNCQRTGLEESRWQYQERRCQRSGNRQQNSDRACQRNGQRRQSRCQHSGDRKRQQSGQQYKGARANVAATADANVMAERRTDANEPATDEELETIVRELAIYGDNERSIGLTRSSESQHRANTAYRPLK